MPSRLTPLFPSHLYEMTFDQKDFIIYAARQYWRPKYIVEPSDTKVGRVIAFVGSQVGCASIGIVLANNKDLEIFTVRKIPSQRNPEEDRDRVPVTVAYGDLLCWLEVIPKSSPVKERMWRLIVRTPDSNLEHTIGCFFSEAQAAASKREYESLSAASKRKYTYEIKEF